MIDGRELRAPIVISDAGAANTYGQLLPRGDVPPARCATRCAASAPSIGYLCLYIGFEHTDEELGLDGHEPLDLPRRGSRRELRALRSPIPRRRFRSCTCRFRRRRTRASSERYPGRATIDVIVPARYEWFAKWEGTRWMKRGDDYDALKERFTKRILDALYAKVPQLRGKIDVCELSTPVTTHHFAGHPRGELYGLDHTPARYRMRSTRTRPHGAVLHGRRPRLGGVSGALLGGVLTAAAILGLRVMRDVTRRRA